LRLTVHLWSKTAIRPIIETLIFIISRLQLQGEYLMNLKIRTTPPLQIKTACLVIGFYEKSSSDPLQNELDQKLGGLLRQARHRGEFSGKTGEQILFQPTNQLPAQSVLLIGLGSKAEASLENLRQAAGRAMQQVIKRKIGQAVFALPLCEANNSGCSVRTQAVAEGILLASYRYDQFLSEKSRAARKLPSTAILLIEETSDKEACTTALDKAQKLCRAVTFVRDLVNTPGNIKSPAYLADQAHSAAAESSLKIKVLGQKHLAEAGCGALLGVAQGSVREPKMIILEHKGGGKNESPVVLVGKGVVFDAGGISLKPAEKMDEMKMDMAGGAAVIGTMFAAGLLNLPLNLVGIVPAVENMPSGTAYRPGDILTSLSGQTIEILNTDAEGRLILADALTYAKRYKPQLVIDLATLTGACIIALGHYATAVLGNDQKLVDALLKAGEECGERLWQLPLWDDYDQQIKSDVADVKNTGGRPAGTITAAAFLKKFAHDFRWAHLDIAGTAWRDSDQPYIAKGGTGIGVRLLVSLLENLTAQAIKSY
jgi:leucyl aminopeptidase